MPSACASPRIVSLPPSPWISCAVPAEGVDALLNVERLRFDDYGVAFDVTPTGNVLDPVTKGEGGNGGKAYRLYQAALAREPDLPGLGYWITQVDNGEPLWNLAYGFITSAEFKDKYGQNPTNEEYIQALYQNVLHRAAEGAGHDYWLAALDSGATTREQMLVDFSESAENKANVIEVIGNGFDYTPWA